MLINKFKGGNITLNQIKDASSQVILKSDGEVKEYVTDSVDDVNVEEIISNVSSKYEFKLNNEKYENYAKSDKNFTKSDNEHIIGDEDSKDGNKVLSTRKKKINQRSESYERKFKFTSKLNLGINRISVKGVTGNYYLGNDGERIYTIETVDEIIEVGSKQFSSEEFRQIEELRKQYERIKESNL